MSKENHISIVQSENDRMYREKKFDAQRKYPNQELLRFMGRNFFKIPLKERSKIKILELGCGSCANLWMIAKEGFCAYGIDVSGYGIKLGLEMLKKWRVKAELCIASATKLPYKDKFFDVVLDVLAMNCMPEKDFEKVILEVKRVLKIGGLFFSYFPSKNSDAFLNHKPAKLIDNSTLNGIYRKNSPYYGNFYPFRFIAPSEYSEILIDNGFSITYLETETRTYRNMTEKFEFVVVEAKKK